MRSPTVIAVIAVAAITAGCSGAAGGGRTTPIAAIQVAYTKTVAARSARVTVTNSFSSAPGKPVTVTTETGLIDFASHRSSLTLHGPNGLSIERRFIGSFMYFYLPGLETKPWVKVDLNKLLGTTSAVRAQLELLNQTADPTTGLDYLKAASAQVELLGNENLGGTATQHYRASIDPQKAAAAAHVGAPSNGPSLQPVVEVWIDNQSQVRQLRYELTGTPSGVKIEQFSDFGVVADIATPPADQTSVLGS